MVSLVPQQSTLGETHRLLPGSEDEHWHRIAGVAVDNILLKARMQQHSLTSLEAPPPIAAPACSPPSVQSTGLASNGHFLSPNLSSVGADGQPSAPPAPADSDAFGAQNHRKKRNGSLNDCVGAKRAQNVLEKVLFGLVGLRNHGNHNPVNPES